MALDGSILGNCASEQMEALDDDFGDDDDVQVGAVMTIVEVLKSAGTDEHGNPLQSSEIRFRHNIGDPYRAVGLVQQVAQDILSAGR